MIPKVKNCQAIKDLDNISDIHFQKVSWTDLVVANLYHQVAKYKLCILCKRQTTEKMHPQLHPFRSFLFDRGGFRLLNSKHSLDFMGICRNCAGIADDDLFRVIIKSPSYLDLVYNLIDYNTFPSTMDCLTKFNHNFSMWQDFHTIAYQKVKGDHVMSNHKNLKTMGEVQSPGIVCKLLP